MPSDPVVDRHLAIQAARAQLRASQAGLLDSIPDGAARVVKLATGYVVYFRTSDGKLGCFTGATFHDATVAQ